MKLLKKAAMFLGAMTLAASSFASSQHIDQCPNVDAIQSQGVSMVLPVDFDMFIGMETSQYDTDSDWVFLIGPIESDDYDDAVGLANDALKTVSGAPMPEEEDGVTFCEYNTGNEELGAFAIAGDDMVSTNKVKQFFHK